MFLLYTLYYTKKKLAPCIDAVYPIGVRRSTLIFTYDPYEDEPLRSFRNFRTLIDVGIVVVFRSEGGLKTEEKQKDKHGTDVAYKLNVGDSH